eukprot:5419315-Ditylum_brightwellii.AAC.1
MGDPCPYALAAHLILQTMPMDMSHPSYLEVNFEYPLLLSMHTVIVTDCLFLAPTILYKGIVSKPAIISM